MLVQVTNLYIYRNGKNNEILGGNVSGIVATDFTLTKAGSPYTVVGDILVSQYATLTIEAGVVLNFMKEKGIRVSFYNLDRFLLYFFLYFF